MISFEVFIFGILHETLCKTFGNKEIDVRPKDTDLVVPDTQDSLNHFPGEFAKLRKKARTLVPDALKGCPKCAKGPVCWKNNLEGCTNETKVVDGVQRCTKGFHVCAQCHKVGHTFANCRAKPKA